MTTKAPVNKSQAIRDALAANPTLSPAEVAQKLKAQGVNVNPQYVSTIKSNSKVAARKVRTPARSFPRSTARPATIINGNPMTALSSGIEFIKVAGGLDEARSILATVEQVKSVISFL